ncbi:hypothetical protein GCM10010441_14220 [Kitasatospora paracochleata]|uniref:Transposase n=1 Tax=Kitasatospora paracochleata TaxID=58354 RepID=A0ABT1JAJ9_9ACTN|nr:transposase [Kitasatospora paracochleata]
MAFLSADSSGSHHRARPVDRSRHPAPDLPGQERDRDGDREAYKKRNTVERCINRLKQWRGLAMRTDRLAIAYQAALHLAAILMWLRR